MFALTEDGFLLYHTLAAAGFAVGWNRKQGMVVGSRSALQQLMFAMSAALDRNEQLWLTVV